MSRLNLGEARLVVVAIDSFDARFTASTALSRGDDRIANAPVRQPPWGAVVQAIVPGCIQLSCGGQLCAVAHTEGFGLPESKTIAGQCMEHLTFKTETDFF